MKKILSLILALVLLLIFTACSNLKNLGNSSKSYQITDSRGKVVTFDKAPQKIISLLPSDTEIIYELGEGSKIIAVDTYSDYPEDAKTKRKLAADNNINIEAIIGLQPDLVFFGQMVKLESQYKQLEDAGIKVIVTDANNIDETYKVIEMIAKSLNKKAKGTQIINGMKKDFEDLKKQVKNNPSKKVYIEISPLQFKLFTCGKGTFQDELLTMIGATNIFSDVTKWPEVSEEQVISRNPEVIITTVDSMFGVSDPVSEIKGRANWNKIDAVKNGKVFVTDSYAIQRPGPRLVTAARDLVKIIYG